MGNYCTGTSQSCANYLTNNGYSLETCNEPKIVCKNFGVLYPNDCTGDVFMCAGAPGQLGDYCGSSETSCTDDNMVFSFCDDGLECRYNETVQGCGDRTTCETPTPIPTISPTLRPTSHPTSSPTISQALFLTISSYKLDFVDYDEVVEIDIGTPKLLDGEGNDIGIATMFQNASFFEGKVPLNVGKLSDLQFQFSKSSLESDVLFQINFRDSVRSYADFEYRFSNVFNEECERFCQDGDTPVRDKCVKIVDQKDVYTYPKLFKDRYRCTNIHKVNLRLRKGMFPYYGDAVNATLQSSFKLEIVSDENTFGTSVQVSKLDAYNQNGEFLRTISADVIKGNVLTAEQFCEHPELYRPETNCYITKRQYGQTIGTRSDCCAKKNNIFVENTNSYCVGTTNTNMNWFTHNNLTECKNVCNIDNSCVGFEKQVLSDGSFICIFYDSIVETKRHFTKSCYVSESQFSATAQVPTAYQIQNIRSNNNLEIIEDATCGVEFTQNGWICEPGGHLLPTPQHKVSTFASVTYNIGNDVAYVFLRTPSDVSMQYRLLDNGVVTKQNKLIRNKYIIFEDNEPIGINELFDSDCLDRYVLLCGDDIDDIPLTIKSIIELSTVDLVEFCDEASNAYANKRLLTFNVLLKGIKELMVQTFDTYSFSSSISEIVNIEETSDGDEDDILTLVRILKNIGKRVVCDLPTDEDVARQIFKKLQNPSYQVKCDLTEKYKLDGVEYKTLLKGAPCVNNVQCAGNLVCVDFVCSNSTIEAKCRNPKYGAIQPDNHVLRPPYIELRKCTKDEVYHDESAWQMDFESRTLTARWRKSYCTWDPYSIVVNDDFFQYKGNLQECGMHGSSELYDLGASFTEGLFGFDSCESGAGNAMDELWSYFQGYSTRLVPHKIPDTMKVVTKQIDRPTSSVSYQTIPQAFSFFDRERIENEIDRAHTFCSMGSTDEKELCKISDACSWHETLQKCVASTSSVQNIMCKYISAESQCVLTGHCKWKWGTCMGKNAKFSMDTKECAWSECMSSPGCDGLSDQHTTNEYGLSSGCFWPWQNQYYCCKVEVVDNTVTNEERATFCSNQNSLSSCLYMECLWDPIVQQCVLNEEELVKMNHTVKYNERFEPSECPTELSSGDGITSAKNGKQILIYDDGSFWIELCVDYPIMTKEMCEAYGFEWKDTFGLGHFICEQQQDASRRDCVPDLYDKFNQKGERHDRCTWFNISWSSEPHWFQKNNETGNYLGVEHCNFEYSDPYICFFAGDQIKVGTKTDGPRSHVSFPSCSVYNTESTCIARKNCDWVHLLQSCVQTKTDSLNLGFQYFFDEVVSVQNNTQWFIEDMNCFEEDLNTFCKTNNEVITTYITENRVECAHDCKMEPSCYYWRYRTTDNRCNFYAYNDGTFSSSSNNDYTCYSKKNECKKSKFSVGWVKEEIIRNRNPCNDIGTYSECISVDVCMWNHNNNTCQAHECQLLSHLITTKVSRELGTTPNTNEFDYKGSVLTRSCERLEGCKLNPISFICENEVDSKSKNEILFEDSAFCSKFSALNNNECNFYYKDNLACVLVDSQCSARYLTMHTVTNHSAIQFLVDYGITLDDGALYKQFLDNNPFLSKASYSLDEFVVIQYLSASDMIALEIEKEDLDSSFESSFWLYETELQFNEFEEIYGVVVDLNETGSITVVPLDDIKDTIIMNHTINMVKHNTNDMLHDVLDTIRFDIFRSFVNSLNGYEDVEVLSDYFFQSRALKLNLYPRLNGYLMYLSMNEIHESDGETNSFVQTRNATGSVFKQFILDEMAGRTMSDNFMFDYKSVTDIVQNRGEGLLEEFTNNRKAKIINSFTRHIPSSATSGLISGYFIDGFDMNSTIDNLYELDLEIAKDNLNELSDLHYKDNRGESLFQNKLSGSNKGNTVVKPRGSAAVRSSSLSTFSKTQDAFEKRFGFRPMRRYSRTQKIFKKLDQLEEFLQGTVNRAQLMAKKSLTKVVNQIKSIPQKVGQTRLGRYLKNTKFAKQMKRYSDLLRSGASGGGGLYKQLLAKGSKLAEKTVKLFLSLGKRVIPNVPKKDLLVKLGKKIFKHAVKLLKLTKWATKMASYLASGGPYGMILLVAELLIEVILTTIEVRKLVDKAYEEPAGCRYIHDHAYSSNISPFRAWWRMGLGGETDLLISSEKQCSQKVSYSLFDDNGTMGFVDNRFTPPECTLERDISRSFAGTLNDDCISNLDCDSISRCILGKCVYDVEYFGNLQCIQKLNVSTKRVENLHSNVYLPENPINPSIRQGFFYDMHSLGKHALSACNTPYALFKTQHYGLLPIDGDNVECFDACNQWEENKDPNIHTFHQKMKTNNNITFCQQEEACEKYETCVKGGYCASIECIDVTDCEGPFIHSQIGSLKCVDGFCRGATYSPTISPTNSPTSLESCFNTEENTFCKTPVYDKHSYPTGSFIVTSSLDECKAACLLSPYCDTFSFRVSPDNRCFFYRGFPESTASSEQYTCNQRICPVTLNFDVLERTFCWHTDLDTSVVSSGTTLVNNFMECDEMCVNSKYCDFYTFRTSPDNRCFFYKGDEKNQASSSTYTCMSKTIPTGCFDTLHNVSCSNDFPDYTIDVTGLDTQLKCERACRDSLYCMFFSFHNNQCKVFTRSRSSGPPITCFEKKDECIVFTISSQCINSNECADNEFCDKSNRCQLKTTCTSTSECYKADFRLKRIPTCVEGLCEDTFSHPSGCFSGKDCTAKANNAQRKRESSGVIDVDFSKVDSKTKLAAKQIVQQMKQQQNITAIITTTERATINGLGDVPIEEVINATRKTVCLGIEDVCRVEQVENELRRQLQSSTVTLLVTYELDESSFETFNSTSFNDTSFGELVASEIEGVTADDISVTSLEGSLTVEIVVESDLESINSVQESLLNVTVAIEETYDLETSVSEIDLCGTRDCNGFGAQLCNLSTGVCNCEGTGYTGIDCQTEFVCENNGVFVNNYCTCLYPFFGQFCENTKQCSCLASNIS